MKVSAAVTSSFNQHVVQVQTNDVARQIDITPKATGFGSSVNGGELLLLSLATCFCNDLYREAALQHISVTGVSVEVTGEFGSAGDPGFNFQYKVKVDSEAAPEIIRELIAHTDRVAEIHKTLRKGVNVTLAS